MVPVRRKDEHEALLFPCKVRRSWLWCLGCLLSSKYLDCGNSVGGGEPEAKTRSIWAVWCWHRDQAAVCPIYEAAVGWGRHKGQLARQG